MGILQGVGARLLDYYAPLRLLAISLYFAIVTLLLQPINLYGPSKFRQAWFGRFFAVIGPQSAANEDHRAVSRELLDEVHGVVLDIGPGLGDQLHLFSPHASNIKRIYAIEPTTMLHERLAQAAEQAGLKGKYIILDAGASPTSMFSALHRAGVDPRQPAFDYIVSIKSLCSCPRRDIGPILQAFQGLLKTGGRYVFLEHVANKIDPLTTLYQTVLNVVWPALMGGCRLDGRMEIMLQKMKGWKKIDVNRLPNSKNFNSIPFVWGQALKG